MNIDPEKLGRWGEAVSGALLRLKGLKVIERNYRVGRLELDIIAVDENELVFVEVKVRRSSDCGGPLGAVGFKKQRDLTRAAAAYVADRRPDVRSFRFDVIGIVLDDRGERMTMRHIERAFQSGDSCLFT